MGKSTITDLPTDVMQAVPNFKENKNIMEIIRQAKEGNFHDYKSRTYRSCKTMLLKMLAEANEPKLDAIIEAVFYGKYDESPDEEDHAQLEKDWLEGWN